MNYPCTQNKLLIMAVGITLGLFACATYQADSYDPEKNQYYSYKNNFTVQIPPGYHRVAQSHIPGTLKGFVDLIVFSDTGVPRAGSSFLAFATLEKAARGKTRFHAETSAKAQNIFHSSELWNALEKSQAAAAKRSGSADGNINIYDYHDFRIIEIPLKNASQSMLAATVYPSKLRSNEYQPFLAMFTIPNESPEKATAVFKRFLDGVKLTAFSEEKRKP